jgi:transcriptional regulator with XRE-family HTH domain
MPYSTVTHIGARVRRTRKDRNLTQRELADISPVSYSTITKVEQGQMAASPSVLAALARALSVPVTELTGQPYLDELRRDQLDSLIQPIREALDIYDLGPDPHLTPRSLPELTAAADKIAETIRATNLKQAASDLPRLIREATTITHDDASDEAWRTLAAAYRSAFDVTSKLGYVDLSTVALDRMEWAAQHASSPVLSGLRQYMRALSYLRDGQFTTGKRLVQIGLRTLEQADAGLERQVATGQMHLGAAVLYARDKSGDDADGHLTEAARIADRTGPQERLHWLSFGPLNVDVHRVAVLAERDLYPEAVQAAKNVRIPASWPRSRASHHHAEVARALMWTGRTEQAFRELQRARKAGPQQTKYHPMVRETYESLDAAQRRAAESFASFGSWLGV